MSDLAARYRERGYWAGHTLTQAFAAWAAAHGDRTAVVDGDRRVTYAELLERSGHVAGGLHARGLRRGDTLVVQLPNGLAFCELLLGALRLGAQPVMALPAHREREIGYMADHARAAALAIPDTPQHRRVASQVTVDHVLTEADIAALDGPAPDGDGRSEDVALFLLSGGTTGLPKLIPRTHDDYAYNARASAELCQLTAADTYLAALPVSHNFPLACPGLLGTWGAGGTVVLARDPRPEAAFPLIAAERVTVTALVPTLAMRWTDSPAAEHDLSSLRLLQVGGARLEPAAARRVTPTLGARLQQVFGMAEGLLNYTRLDDADEVVVNTQGRPLCADDELRIVDPAGDPVAPGTPGELLTRGPYTLRGYHRADDHNARAFTPDGFYRSGDLVLQRADGNLVVTGREKDLINRGGEKIAASEIENLALEHPAVVEAAAVAMPDPDLGERTCLFAVLREPLALTELCGFLSGLGIARFKLPERLEPLQELPVTKVGKVDKVVLREWAS